jgi:amidase
MEGDEVCFLSARAMAEEIRRGRLSAREVVAAHLQRIERDNPKLNAIVTLVADRAMEQASAADELQARGKLTGPLHGLPVAHKDLQDTAGIRTTYGSLVFRDHVPELDSQLVECLNKAGAIAIGKTNTPEFGAGSQTFNEVFGVTRNPYDLTKTPGGSSGGAAVAVACGMVPLADGSDMGGSLRNPASFCNVVGMRTSPGFAPHWPALTGWSTLGVEGPMARTVGDAAFFLSAMAGPDPRCPVSTREAGSQFAQPLDRDFRGIRVAWFKDLGWLPFDPRVREVVDAQRRVFESLGCVVEEAEPDFAGADEAFRIIRASLFHMGLGGLPPEQLRLVKESVVSEIEQGGCLTAADLSRAGSLRTELYFRIHAFFERYDFFVLPTSQVPPFDVSRQWVTEIDGVAMETYIDWMRSCYYISVTGSPALAVPAGFTADGLPVGLQIVGRHTDNWGVLQLGHAFEQVNGAGQRRPVPAH